jgi:CCR4-NOT transcriptional regulation complex NOT5 subunit
MTVPGRPVLPFIDRQSEVPTITKEYITEYVQQISGLSNREKVAQIGLDPGVLGMPRDDITFASIRSYFSDVPYEAVEPVKLPKEWLDFSRLPSPVDIIHVLPDLTLFFMFYTQPGDVVQISASEELKQRGWNYEEIAGKWSFEDGGHVFEFDLHSWAIKKCAGVSV